MELIFWDVKKKINKVFFSLKKKGQVFFEAAKEYLFLSAKSILN